MIVRPSTPQDLQGIETLLITGEIVLRHLDWLDATGWFGNDSTLLLFDHNDICALLVMPEEPTGIHWLRMLLKRRELALDVVLKAFWAYVNMHKRETFFAAVILQNADLTFPFQQIGFTKGQSIVFLRREEHTKYDRAPMAEGLLVRPFSQTEIDVVERVDHACFSSLWRNSKRTLLAGLAANGYGTVAQIDGKVVGYQLSNLNYGGIHLARLAVMPEHQGKGIASALLANLFQFGDAAGCGMITVNTQSDNATSLKLYQRSGFRLAQQAFPVLEYRTRGDSANAHI